MTPLGDSLERMPEAIVNNLESVHVDEEMKTYAHYTSVKNYLLQIVETQVQRHAYLLTAWEVAQYFNEDHSCQADALAHTTHQTRRGLRYVFPCQPDRHDNSRRNDYGRSNFTLMRACSSLASRRGIVPMGEV